MSEPDFVVVEARIRVAFRDALDAQAKKDGVRFRDLAGRQLEEGAEAMRRLRSSKI